MTTSPDPARFISTGIASGIVLVGRNRERAMLRETLGFAFAGRGSLVLLGGEAGIGKTALAEAICAEAEQRGATVLVGRCYDLAETPPYGPWREALGTLFPTALNLTGRDERVASQDALFAQAQSYLAHMVTERPLLLFLDDLHWADRASLDLLRVLARGLTTMPILSIATYRADELTHDHPLYQFLPLLVREAHATQLDLRTLPQEAVRVLLREIYALDEAEEDRLAGYLHDRAEGHPFFTCELLRTLEDEGVLHPSGVGWKLGNLGAIPVPRLLRQVIDGRLMRLDTNTQRLLAIAAVMGATVPLELWAAVGETDEGGLLTAVEAGVSAGLIAETADGAGVQFTHALIREALYERTTAIRRRGWHRRIAEALTLRPGADPDEVAHHFQRAGDERAYYWLVQAGERAQRAYAWLAAADRFEAALKLLGAADNTATERGWLLFHLARLRRYTNPADGIVYLDEAARLERRGADPVLAACIPLERGLLRCFVGEIQTGIAEMRVGIAAYDALSPEEQARSWKRRSDDGHPIEDDGRATLALWLDMTGRFAEVRAIAERMNGAASVGVDAQAALVDTYASLGLPDDARHAGALALSQHRASGHYLQLGLVLFDLLSLVALPYAADDLVGRRQLTEESRQALARASGVLPGGEPLDFARLPLLYLEGQWDEAQRLAATQQTFRAPVTAILGPLARERGDADQAWDLVRQWLPSGPETEPGEGVFRPTSDMQLLAARLALDAGDLPAAHNWLVAHERWLDWAGAALGRVESHLGWAAYHCLTGDSAQAYEHVARALRLASNPRQPLGLLAAHRFLGELHIAEARYTEAAAHLDTALALADASFVPYERALTLLAKGELHHNTGEFDSARSLLTEARAILDTLAAKPAIARVDALVARLSNDQIAPASFIHSLSPFGLSAREQEVLRLLADGLTDLQIAERLFISRHTVNTHLRAIYGKLGVTSRAAAARRAAEHGLA